VTGNLKKLIETPICPRAFEHYRIEIAIFCAYYTSNIAGILTGTIIRIIPKVLIYQGFCGQSGLLRAEIIPLL